MGRTLATGAAINEALQIAMAADGQVTVGQMVMEALSNLDKVAYVRFASVYRNFREARDFEDFENTWFLSLSISDLPGAIYWLTR